MKNRPLLSGWPGWFLEEQSFMPIQNPDEMGLCRRWLRLGNPRYIPGFSNRLLPGKAQRLEPGESLAAFEQTLETVDSRFDDWSNNEGSLCIRQKKEADSYSLVQKPGALIVISWKILRMTLF